MKYYSSSDSEDESGTQITIVAEVHRSAPVSTKSNSAESTQSAPAAIVGSTVVPKSAPAAVESNIVVPKFAPAAVESNIVVPKSAPAAVESSTVVPKSAPAAVESSTVVPKSAPAAVESSTVVPKSAPAAVESNTVVPKSAPAAVESSTVVPKSAPAAVESSTVVPKSAPAAVESSTVVPKSAPAAVESNTVVPKSAPAAVESSTVVPKSAPAAVESNTDVPKSAPAAVESNTVVPKSAPVAVESNTVVPKSAPAAVKSTVVPKPKSAPAAVKSSTIVPAPAAAKSSTILQHTAPDTIIPIEDAISPVGSTVSAGSAKSRTSVGSHSSSARSCRSVIVSPAKLSDTIITITEDEAAIDSTTTTGAREIVIHPTPSPKGSSSIHSYVYSSDFDTDASSLCSVHVRGSDGSAASSNMSSGTLGTFSETEGEAEPTGAPWDVPECPSQQVGLTTDAIMRKIMRKQRVSGSRIIPAGVASAALLDIGEEAEEA